nr:MAG TPA: hypothetical protein [Caudoviricetes sp.]
MLYRIYVCHIGQNFWCVYFSDLLLIREEENKRVRFLFIYRLMNYV